MNVTDMTKLQVAQALEAITRKVRAKQSLEPTESYFLEQICFYVEQEVIAAIRLRQERIRDLIVWNHGYTARWGGELTPGCRICLEGTGLMSIRSVSECNLDCSFCYYAGSTTPRLLSQHFRLNEPRRLTEDDVKLVLDRQGGNLQGLSWVFFEPFMDFDKHPSLIKYISDRGIWQWMYTNGVLVTEDHMKILRDSGLRELRFNLAATNCSKQVLATMRVARKYFPYLCIESPMYRAYAQQFMKHWPQIMDTGVDHINCAELHLSEGSARNFADEVLYCYKSGYVSPVSSRQLTYDVIERAQDEGLKGVVINDCSNQTKFCRGIERTKEYRGTVGYTPQCTLTMKWYADALQRYDCWDRICRPSTDGQDVPPPSDSDARQSNPATTAAPA